MTGTPNLNPPLTEGAGALVPKPSAQVDLTPMGMLERAVTSGASIDVLEKLMGLQERW